MTAAAFPGNRCPRCQGPIEDTSEPRASTSTFRCLQEGSRKNCEWNGLMPEKGGPETAAPEKPPARGRRALGKHTGEGRSSTRAIESSSAAAWNEKKKKETTMTKQQTKRLANLNYKAKKAGHAPPFTDLAAGEKWAAANCKRGQRGAGTADTATPLTPPLLRGDTGGSRRGRREHSASPAPAPPGSNGHGTERDLNMLGGVIIQELQKERAALDLAISVIERRFRGVKEAQP